MFGTLFFDEARVNTAFRIRQLPQQQATPEASTYVAADAEERQRDEGSLTAAHGCTFSCRGEVALPSLRASLLWWLDADASVVQLLVVNDSESSEAARASQSRLLSVEVPAAHPSEILTCGVTKNYMGDHGVVVAWVLCGVRNGAASYQREQGHGVTAGYAQVTVQRETDTTGHSSLLLIPEDQMVACAPLTRIPSEAFVQVAAAGRSGSACVVAELPSTASARTASLVVLSDGARLWRAELFRDGAVGVTELADDPHRRNGLRSLCDGNEEVRLLDTRTVAADVLRLSSPASDDASALDASTSASRSTWIRRFLGSGAAGRNGSSSGSGTGSGMRHDEASLHGFPGLDLPPAIRCRLYAAVSAVQQSPFIALTRWNGQVEIYEVESDILRLASQYPIGIVPHALLRPLAADAASRAKAKSAMQRHGQKDCLYALPAGHTTQWATRNPSTHQVHVVTCLADGGDGRPCLWTALPMLPPPTNLDGAVQGQAGEILAQHCTVSVAAPTLASDALACTVTADGRRLVLVSDIGVEEDGHLLCSRSLAALTLSDAQLTTKGVATIVQVVKAEGGGGLLGLPRTSQLLTYLCHGARMQGVVARGDALVLAERGVQPCRLFTMEDAAADALTHMTESVVVGVEEEDVYGTVDRHDGAEATAMAGSYSSAGGLASPRRVHYVPLVETAPLAFPVTKSAGDPFAVFWEGVNVIRFCAHGARFMSAVLKDVLLATAPITELASLPQLLSEAHLSGYTAALQRGAPSTKASVMAAVRLALSPSCDDSGAHRSPSVFYKYSRLYVTEAAMRSLLSRLTFLTTVFLGWQSTQSVVLAATSSFLPNTATTSADWVTQQVATALEILVAAYHAVPLAGPDVVQMALVDDDAAQPTGAAIVAALLPALPSIPDNSNSNNVDCLGVRAISLVQVVNRLRRCGTPRTARACAAWVKQLTQRFPLLQHYQLLSLLDTAAAATHSARVQACCERVCHALASETPADVMNLLFLEDLFLMDAAGAGTGSAFRSVPLEEVAAFVAAVPAMGPKLYAVGVLRRVTGLGGLYTSVNTTVTRRYLYSMLALCDGWAEKLQRRATAAAASSPAPFQLLRKAFAELQVDVLLTAAQARVSQADMAGCFHDVQTALDMMPGHRCLSSYAEVVQLILSTAVEVACASQANMSALLRTTTIGVAQLEESLILKWYNYIARLPTKSASEATEALRYRAIMGLHRYLMNHHSYAQCARLMSSLATLIRCSPLRRSAAAGISVSELAGLALHAATLIAPSVPMPESGATSNSTAVGVANTSHNASAAAVMAGSPLSLGYSWQPSSLSASPLPVDPASAGAAEASGAAAAAAAAGHAQWLTRADIPWLQRRLYQAQCERQLWRRGCTLDCTDLWVEGAPAGAYRLAVEKLVCALMQARLWPQAFRSACLSGVYDSCTVLEEWAVDLLQEAQHSRSSALASESEAARQVDRAAAWEELIGYCSELSTLQNQFSAFVRTATTALTFAYEDVPADLLTAHRLADAYTAMSTLFHVALLLRKRADMSAAASGVRDGEGGAEEEEGEGVVQNGATSSSSASSSSSTQQRDGVVVVRSDGTCLAAPVESMRQNVWRAFGAAARIGVEIGQTRELSREVRGRGVEEEGAVASRSVLSPFTAGVVDPMVVCATELLGTPAYREVLPSVPGMQLNIQRFLDSVRAPRG